jgi:hypothetical protein
MDTLRLLAFGLVLLSIVLGFIALLTQKIYLDASTQKPIDIDIPLFGRMKTNYPALIFVFLGFSLAFYVLHDSFSSSGTDWTIKGQFSDPSIIDWKTGTLSVFPAQIKANVNNNGMFTIDLKIKEGKTLENTIEKIEYSHRIGDAIIYPSEEYALYQSGQKSKLEHILPHGRRYGSIPIKHF